MATQPYEMTATELVSGFAEGSLSPTDALESILERSEAQNPAINALIYMDIDGARKEAQKSTQRWRENAPKGLLDGVPVTIKDSIALADRPMVRGSAANRSNPPVTFDAPPSSRLKEAGAILFAKTTMPDFGVLASGVSSAFGVTRNPWNLSCNTGGSSAGAGAALAARCGPLGVGSDVAGSVRFPAAYCGLVGHKPSAGRVPHLPASFVRVAGPLARTTQDAALLLTVLSAGDGRDHLSLPASSTPFHENLNIDLSSLTLGLLLEDELGRLPESAVAQAVEDAALILEKAGATIKRISSPVGTDFNDALGKFLLMRGAIECSHLSPEAKSHVPEFFTEWFKDAEQLSAIDIGLSMDKIEQANGAAHAQMSEVDFILSPVVGHAAYPADARQWTDDGQHGLYYAAIWNQTGNPASSIPCGMDKASGLPIGLQIVGQRFDDHGVLKLCATYEALRGFDMIWPE